MSIELFQEILSVVKSQFLLSNYSIGIKMKFKLTIFIAIFLLMNTVANSQTQFTPIWSGNGYLNMNIYITSAELDGNNLEAGDEIGIFDGSDCVGALVLTGPIQSFVAILAATDDPGTGLKDGFTSGNPIIIKLWKTQYSTDVVKNVSTGSGNFVSQGTVVFEVIGTTITESYPSAVGDNNLVFTNSKIVLDFNTGSVESITSSYYNSFPFLGLLPDGYENISNYFWTVDGNGILFTNGKIKVLLSDLVGVDDPADLIWVKRENVGDNWTDIGGTISSNYLESTIPFTSFSEFAIASIENGLPVELVSFHSLVKKNNVLLEWTTASELNNYGFEIQRKITDKWEKIGFVHGNGNSNNVNNYFFQDEKITGKIVEYRLKQIDNEGRSTFSNILTVNLLKDFVYKLDHNYPNPFNPITIISFSIAEDMPTKLTIYDLLGNEMKVLVNEVKLAGSYDLKFNASFLASGLYLYRLKAGNFVETKKMILLK